MSGLGRTLLLSLVIALLLSVSPVSVLVSVTDALADEPLSETRRAAEQGDASAQYRLGLEYYMGVDVPEDFAEAAKWYRMAAEQGHASAQHNLGSMYFFGQGFPRDYAEAAKWHRGAAEQGHASAQNRLGHMYYEGKGIPQDHAEAAKWYRMAAEQGEVPAQLQLGTMYYRGEGVPRDYVQAYKWANLAAILLTVTKHPDSGAALLIRERSAREMTESDILEANRLTTQWWPDRCRCGL